MDVLWNVIAGCATVTPECAAGTAPNGMDTWFMVLVLFLFLFSLLAAAAGAAFILRSRSSRCHEAVSSTPEPPAHA